MNIRHSMQRCLSGLGLAVAGLYLSGCAVNMPVSASPKLTTENPINKIALLGDSSVVWPGGSNRSLGLEASKETLSLALPLIKQELSILGYDVSYAQSVAVGVKNPADKERWVYPAAGEPKGKLGDSVSASASSSSAATFDSNSFGEPYQITDGKPAYVYPKFASGTTLGDATLSVFDAFDSATNKSAFVIPEDSLNLLRSETSADTLCMARITGERFTAARKAGALAMNALTIWFGVVVIPPTDVARVGLVCFESSTGTYLWSGMGQLGDPEKPVANLLSFGLGTFPRKGETLSPQCEVDQTTPMTLKCKPRDAATKNATVELPKIGAL
jgi:hypothetical protein